MENGLRSNAAYLRATLVGEIDSLDRLGPIEGELDGRRGGTVEDFALRGLSTNG